MESLYASNWIVQFVDKNISQELELLSKLLRQARTAQGIREENRAIIIDTIKKCQWNIVNSQRAIGDLASEIELAMQLYRVDVPEHKDQYFTFDEAGEIHTATKEEYDAVTPPGIPEEVAETTYGEEED